MLRELLIERFKLGVHHEMREMPVYDLVVAKGEAKVREAIPTPVDAPKVDVTELPKLQTGKDGVTGTWYQLRHEEWPGMEPLHR